MKSFVFGLTLTVLLLAAPISAAGAVGLGGVCAGAAGVACDPGLRCELAAAACGRADAQGQCRSASRSCNMAAKPVCGCDGHTYVNECERMRAGAQKAHGGACAGKAGPHRRRREKDATGGQT